MADKKRLWWWEVAREGYKWDDLDDRGLTVPVLVPVVWTWKDHREYDPMEDHALFRIFAEVELSREAILGFANRYGDLGGRRARGVVGPNPTDCSLSVTPLVEWVHQILYMRQAVGLWSLVKEKDQAGLA